MNENFFHKNLEQLTFENVKKKSKIQSKLAKKMNVAY